MSRFVLTAQLQLQAPNNVRQVVQQIQSQLQGVNVNVQVQGSPQAQRQLQQVTQQANQATSAAERMGKAFALSIRRFAAFSIATRAVGLFTSTLNDAVNSSIDFERQLIKVAQVTGKSVGQLRGLTKQITDLSTGFGVASSDLLEVSTVLAQAGLSAEDTSVALKTLAKAALAPNFDSISETAEGAIAILAQFQEGVGALENQLGSINAVAGAFAVEASDLIDVVRRTGGVFKSSGGNLNELLALFTSVRATTRESAESIGTGLRTIFTRIQRPKTIEFLKQFGVELTDLNGKFVGPYEAIRKLSQALSGLGEGDITFIKIAEELGGFRQIGKVLPLLQQFSTAQSALNVAMKAGDSLTQDAASAQAALAIRIMKVKEEFLALIRSVTETSTFQVMANTALSLASALIKIGDAIKPLLPMLAALTAVKLVKGMGGFLGGMMSGATSGRAYNKGGKVLGFARGGLVPGTGNSDTVPAMLAPGEFVIRKSSVNKMGAGTLAAMNENRYAEGGIIALNPYDKGTPDTAIRKSGSISVADVAERAGIPANKGYRERFSQAAISSGNKELSLLAKTGKLNIDAIGLSIGDESVATETERQIKDNFAQLINNSSGALAKRFQASTSKQITSKDLEVFGINGVIGNAFEAMLTSLGAPFDSPPQDEMQKAVSKANNNSAFDYPNGIGMLGKGNLSVLSGIPTDAKRTVTGKEVNEIITKKYPNLLADAAKQAMVSIKGQELSSLPAKDGGYTKSELTKYGVRSVKELQNAGWTTPFRGKWNPPVTKHFGGLIQRFAEGGEVIQQGTQKYLASDVVKAMRELQGNPSLSEKDAIDLFTSKDARGDFIYTNWGGKGSIKPPKWLAPYTPPPSAAYSAWEKAQADRQNRIADAMHKQGRTMRDYEGQTSDQKNFLASRGLGYRRKRYASGGDVGTDTVPALLTPGEFVVNRASAQRIGYGNLNRMNKIGKYANGGVVQHFAAGSSGNGVTPPPVPPKPPGSLDAFNAFFKSTSDNTKNLDLNSKALQDSRKNTLDVVKSNKMFAASMATSLIQGFLPAIDDSSSATLKVTHNLLGLVTTVASVGFALEAFGLNLKKQTVMDFFKGKSGAASSITEGLGLNRRAISQRASFLQSPQGGGMGRFGALRQAASESKAGFGFSGEGVGKFTAGIGKATQAIVKLAGPVLAIAGSAYVVTKAFSAVIEGIYDFDGRLKKAIDKGNVQDAGRIAGEKQTYENANGGRAIGATIGAGLGMFGGPVGAAVGAAIGATISTLISTYFPELFEGLSYLFGGNTRASAVAMAEAQAQATKTTKALERGQKDAEAAMKDFQNGTISAADALKRIENVQNEVDALGSKTSYAMATNDQNKSTGAYAVARNVFTLGGMLGESASARNARIDKENADSNKNYMDAQRQSFAQSSELRNATMRSAAARGLNTEQAYGQLGGFDPRKLRSQAQAVAQQAQQAYKRGDTETGDQLNDRFKLLMEQAREVEKAFENVKQEVEKAKKSFEAMNLGLRSASATASAMSASLTRFSSNLEVGGSSFVNDVEFLQQALSSSAQAMDPDEIKGAVSNVSSMLKEFGTSDEYIKKFEGNMAAFTQAQMNYNKAFDNIKKSMAANDFRSLSANDLKSKFAEELTKGLGPDVSDAAKENLKSVIQGMELSTEEVDKILAGDLSVFGDKLSESQKKMLEDVQKIAQERAKAEQVLIDFTKKRIDAERAYAEAQKEAVDLMMEGRDVQAKYGGTPVSYTEKRDAIMAKANAGNATTGLSNMRTGGLGELRRRNQEIRSGFENIEARRRQEGGMSGKAGVAADEKQKDLQKAQKDQVQTIRDLIKLEEEQLKITQEKNKLEKESLESLVKGDVEEFFKKQAAVGATAAIASGDERLMGLYGADALGTASLDIQRQQEAGVQSIYGQQLSGPGGLSERAAGAALSARGVTDLRAAQVMAGTTGEEEAIKARLRELGGALSETGQLGADLASMQVKTAVVNLEAAEVKFAETLDRGNAAAEEARRIEGQKAVNKYRGGLIYASRGIFVPRGTDTVPAMLTPGEFVVNRAAVQRDNNLSILQAMNNGSNSVSSTGEATPMAKGGIVRYRSGGSEGAEQPASASENSLFSTMSKFADSLMNFNKDLASNISSLSKTQISIKFDSANVNVNLNDGGLLKALKSDVQKEIFNLVKQKLVAGSDGKLREGGGVLNNSPPVA